MTISELSPRPGERVFVTGNSGSGKSTLSRYIAIEMAKRQPLIIIDPKGEIDVFQGRETIITKPGPIKRASVIRYIPSVESDVPEEVNTILTSAYHAGNIAIWVDELYAITENVATQNLTGLRAILTRGRSKKVTFLGLAQRPAWVPLFCISETTRQFVFCLPMKEDRDRMAAIVGSDKLLRVLPKYEFWYSETNEPDEVHGPLKLEL